jgi:leucyl aminopeptidase
MVEVRVRRGSPRTVRTDLIIIPVVEGATRAALRALEPRLAALLVRRIRKVEFRARPDEVLVHHGETPVALVGLGKAPVAVDAWRLAGARGRQEAERQRARRVAADVSAAARTEEPAAFVEGFQLAGYRFAGYASDAERRARVQSLDLLDAAGAANGLGPGLSEVRAVVPETFRARDFVNEPASVATPRFLAERVLALADEVPGLEAEAWGPERIAREGLAGLMAVARGSREEPRFIKLRHAGGSARHPRRIILVGKGITFDSGGLSLKAPKSMETMKYDMAGGAAVIGAVAAAARLGLPIDVTGYVPATENLPGGQAQKPGDVIRFLNGKTVEVLNTDAEGRLILADALALASRQKPDVIIDLATLTGACRVALGPLFAGVMGNDEQLVDDLVAAGRASGERLWQLPLVREYRDELKSPVADLKNVGGDAGTIVAGLFLQEFVDGVAWAHLDIAGPAFTEKDLPLTPRGGTGFGVRLLVRYLQRAAQAGGG